MLFLDVDLSRDRVGTRQISEEEQWAYLGGSGLGAKILYDTTGPQTDPLGPENTLVFSIGPLTGTGFPCSGRHSIVAKSPLTGLFAESDVGGRWGTELAKTGWSGLIIRGRAETPVYLLITPDGVQIHNAGEVWGKDTFESSALLTEKWGKGVQAAIIGPAGEKHIPLACIMHDGPHARAAGRCGLGAVMGSKNLKAVLTQGTKHPTTYDAAKFKTLARTLNQQIKSAGKALSTCGTAGGIMSLEASGDLPIKNFRQSRWPEAEKLSGEVLAELYLTGRYHCGACPIGCGREIRIDTSHYGSMQGAGPEYESVGTLGSYCLVHDLEAVCRANDLCNRYGLDTISTGAAIALGMEAYERELLSSQDTGGVPLEWGNGSAVVEMVRQIGDKTGCGALLGRGVRQAAKDLGPPAEEFSLHVKGLELPAHDPRAFFSSALSYATSNRGACHLAGFTHGLEDSLTMPELGYHQPLDPFATRGKGEMVAGMQDLMGLFDSLKVCKFVLGALRIQDLLQGLQATSGRNLELSEFLLTGERIFNLKRMFNILCGVSRKDDTLPLRVMTRARDGGRAKGQLPPLGPMLSDYYSVRGWDEFGRPQPETLYRLGLKEEEFPG
ncbi:MAG: aldehyde ferredoxin oxidoreductase family protein [Desulfovermiculus sp.]